MKNLRCGFVLLAAVALVAWTPFRAVAQDDTEVEVLEWGEFRLLEYEEQVPNPPCAPLYVGLVSTGEVIETAPGVCFGIVFTVRWPEVDEGGIVVFQVRVRKPDAYGPDAMETWEVQACTDAKAFAGWACDADQGIEAGEWGVELLLNGDVVAERSFDVRPLPGFARDLPAAGESDAGLDQASFSAKAEPGSWTLSPEPTGIVLQVRAYEKPTDAESLAALLTDEGYPARVEVVEDAVRGRTWHAVRLGDFMTRADAERAAAQFTQWEIWSAFVVAQ